MMFTEQSTDQLWTDEFARSALERFLVLKGELSAPEAAGLSCELPYKELVARLFKSPDVGAAYKALNNPHYELFEFAISFLLEALVKKGLWLKGIPEGGTKHDTIPCAELGSASWIIFLGDGTLKYTLKTIKTTLEPTEIKKIYTNVVLCEKQITALFPLAGESEKALETANVGEESETTSAKPNDTASITDRAAYRVNVIIKNKEALDVLRNKMTGGRTRHSSFPECLLLLHIMNDAENLKSQPEKHKNYIAPPLEKLKLKVPSQHSVFKDYFREYRDGKHSDIIAQFKL